MPSYDNAMHYVSVNMQLPNTTGARRRLGNMMDRQSNGQGFDTWTRPGQGPLLFGLFFQFFLTQPLCSLVRYCLAFVRTLKILRPFFGERRLNGRLLENVNNA